MTWWGLALGALGCLSLGLSWGWSLGYERGIQVVYAPDDEILDSLSVGEAIDRFGTEHLRAKGGDS